MKGKTVIINGDPWTVVDVAPAAPLAEMVAVILEDEGIVSLVRGADLLGDVFSHLGSTSAQTSYVLVPEAEAERATRLIAETVTDFEGEELEELLAAMERGELPEELAPGAWGEEEDEEAPGEPDDGAGGGGGGGRGPSGAAGTA